MKKIVKLVSFAILINLNSIFAVDKYTVVKVLGNITIKKTGVQLKQGDVILANEPIDFKTSEAKASVISSEKGRFILSASNAFNGISNVKSNLLPPMGNISSRSGLILNLTDLKTNFSENYLILKQVELSIGKSVFPMNDSSFFYFSYLYKQENINKKLSHKNDTLLIIEKELFLVDGLSIAHSESTSVKLNYKSGKSSLFITEFNVITPNNDQIVKEVKIILDQSKNKIYKDVLEDVISYFTEFYGKTDSKNVKNWLKDNFNFQQ